LTPAIYIHIYSLKNLNWKPYRFFIFLSPFFKKNVSKPWNCFSSNFLHTQSSMPYKKPPFKEIGLKLSALTWCGCPVSQNIQNKLNAVNRLLQNIIYYTYVMYNIYKQHIVTTFEEWIPLLWTSDIQRHEWQAQKTEEQNYIGKFSAIKLVKYKEQVSIRNSIDIIFIKLKNN